jgi:aminoglycoside 6'-N-acetyltransferase I
MMVRRAGESDLEPLVALAAAFYRQEGFRTPEAALRAHLRVLLGQPAARVAVIGQDGALLAFAITTTSFGLENGLIAELEDLYVRPDARQTGCGQALIEDSRRWARGIGCSQLELVIAPNDGDPTHLDTYYQARGFRDEGRRLLSQPL